MNENPNLPLAYSNILENGITSTSEDTRKISQWVLENCIWVSGIDADDQLPDSKERKIILRNDF